MFRPSIFRKILFGFLFYGLAQSISYAQTNDELINNLHLTGIYRAAITGDIDSIEQSIGKPMQCVKSSGYSNGSNATVEIPPDVNSIDSVSGYTMLDLATLGNQIQVCSYLIAHGADINLRNRMGVPALMYAATRGYVHIFACLVHHGADINITLLPHMRTPAHYAVMYGRADIIAFLKKKHAHFEAKDFFGNTPLMLAQKMRGALSIEDEQTRLMTLSQICSVRFKSFAHSVDQAKKDRNKIIAILMSSR